MTIPPSPRRWYHFRWWQILLLLIAVFAGWYGIYTWLGHRELQAVLSEWDKLGRWRYADLIANQQAEDHNSVSSWVIRQARPITWNEIEDEMVHFKPREYEPNLLLHEDTIQYLRKRASGLPKFLEQLKELDTIPDKPGIGPLNTDPIVIYYAYAEETRKVSLAINEHFWLALQEKDTALAMELLRYKKRLAQHQLSEPFLVNQMTGDSCFRWYLENIHLALAQCEFTDKQLKQLSTELGEFDSLSAWQKNLLAEASQTFHYLEYLSQSNTDILKLIGRLKSIDTWERCKQYIKVFQLRADLQSSFFRAEIMRSILNVYEQQEKPLLDLFLELDRQNDALKKQGRDELDSKNLSTPRLHYRLNTIMRLSASWRCTQIALAAERFRLQHQRWPRTQDELIPQYLPAVLLDPFDDKPLRLKTVEDGLLIYSVVGSSLDREFTDDGGDIQRTEEKYTTKDTGVKLWNPARRRKPAKPLEKREEE